MDFKLTAEQLELQKVARDFAQKELTAWLMKWKSQQSCAKGCAKKNW